MQPASSSEYRIAPELQRCCWYTIFGACVLAPIFVWVAHFAQNRGTAGIIVGCVLFAILAAAMFIPLRWRLRVDSQGISRRRLEHWDSWPWSALASGRMVKLHPYTLHDPERPWWCRTLRFEYMADGDIQEVIAMINTHYKLPPPPNISSSLTIKYGFRRWAAFDSNGIRLTVGNWPQDYSWRDLRDVHITRMDPLRRDFKRLVVTLPDQEIELKLFTHQGGTSPTWKGATAEELNEIFFRFAPADRITVSIAGQQLEKRQHIERALAEAEKLARQLLFIIIVFLAFSLGVLIWMAIDHGVVAASAMGAMFVLFPGVLMWFQFRLQRKRVSELRDSWGRSNGERPGTQD